MVFRTFAWFCINNSSYIERYNGYNQEIVNSKIIEVTNKSDEIYDRAKAALNNNSNIDAVLSFTPEVVLLFKK